MTVAHKWTFALFGLVAFGGVHAQQAHPDAPFLCGGGDGSTDRTTLAEVVGDGRAHFVAGTDDCPPTADRCREKAYLIPGDQVLAGAERGDYACVMFPDNQDGHAGWLPRDRLRPVQAQPSPSAWEGDWVQGDNRITIRHHNGILHADGKAYYPMADPPPDQFPGGPNLGAMGGEARPSGHHATFVDDACEVSAFLVGKFLVVSDNHQCGGLNVRFDGTYRRR